MPLTIDLQTPFLFDPKRGLPSLEPQEFTLLCVVQSPSLTLPDVAPALQLPDHGRAQ